MNPGLEVYFLMCFVADMVFILAEQIEIRTSGLISSSLPCLDRCIPPKSVHLTLKLLRKRNRQSKWVLLDFWIFFLFISGIHSLVWVLGGFGFVVGFFF